MDEIMKNDFHLDDAGFEEISMQAIANAVGDSVDEIIEEDKESEYEGLFLPSRILELLDKNIPREAIIEHTNEDGETYTSVPAIVIKYLAAKTFRDRWNTQTIDLSILNEEDISIQKEGFSSSNGYRVIVKAHVRVTVKGEGGMCQVHSCHGVGTGEAFSYQTPGYKGRAYKMAIKGAETDALVSALERYGPGLIRSKDARAVIAYIKSEQRKRQSEKERAAKKISPGGAGFSGRPKPETKTEKNYVIPHLTKPEDDALPDFGTKTIVDDRPVDEACESESLVDRVNEKLQQAEQEKQYYDLFSMLQDLNSEDEIDDFVSEFGNDILGLEAEYSHKLQEAIEIRKKALSASYQAQGESSVVTDKNIEADDIVRMEDEVVNGQDVQKPVDKFDVAEYIGKIEKCENIDDITNLSEANFDIVDALPAKDKSKIKKSVRSKMQTLLKKNTSDKD